MRGAVNASCMSIGAQRLARSAKASAGVAIPETTNMRLPQPRSAVFPRSGPSWDIVVASVFMVVVTASLISAKTMAYMGVIFIALLMATLAARGKLSLALLRPSGTTLPIAAFLAYATIAISWTELPSDAAIKLATITMIGLTALVAVRALSLEPPASAARLAESLWIGFGVGLLYLFLRNVTNGDADTAILPTAVHAFIKFDTGEVTRSIAPVTLLLGPALLAISAGFIKPWRTIFAAAIVMATVLAVATSPHETSKLALVMWFVVFGLAYISDRVSHKLVLAGWAAACLLVIPASIFAQSQDLQNATWLQRTAQYRILIWNEFARLTLDAPILGHGFDMAATSKPKIPGMAELPYLQDGRKIPSKLKPYRAIHPHNAYLQIWYELGAVGTGLFLAAGLSIMTSLSKLQPHQRPYMYATAAATTVMLFASYGLWQVWFIGLLGFAALSSMIAIRLSAAPGAMAQAS